MFDDTARSSSCPLLLSFLFNVNIIPATLSSSELAVVVPELWLGRRAGGWRQIPLHGPLAAATHCDISQAGHGKRLLSTLLNWDLMGIPSITVY